MQIDMHYYGVYAMARAAGLTREASGRIATASELVDDNAEEEYVEFGDGGRLDLMPTAHHTLDTENRNEEMQRKVWVPFHSANHPIKTITCRSCTTIRTTEVKVLNDAAWRFLSPSRRPESLRRRLHALDRRRPFS